MPAVDPDRNLLVAAQEGSLSAFEELVRSHQAPVYRIALRMLGSAADAEDVAQEAFLQAWRSLSRFRGDSTFDTWLYRIVTNRALNLLKSRRRTTPLAEIEIESRDEPATVVAQRERMRAIVGALKSIEPEQRALIVLRELEGLPYAKIGEVLGLNPSLVKGRLHRARLALVTAVGEPE